MIGRHEGRFEPDFGKGGMGMDCFQETFVEFIRQANTVAIQRPAALLVRIATRASELAGY